MPKIASESVTTRRQTARRTWRHPRELINAIAAALRKHYDQETLLEDIPIGTDPKEACARIRRNMEKQSKWRHNQEWYSMTHLGVYIIQYQHDNNVETEQAKIDLGIPFSDYYLAIMLANIFRTRPEALKHLEEFPIYNAKQLSRLGYERTENSILAAFPIDEDDEQESEEEI